VPDTAHAHAHARRSPRGSRRPILDFLRCISRAFFVVPRIPVDLSVDSTAMLSNDTQHPARRRI
jgi:hypothetical protein